MQGSSSKWSANKIFAEYGSLFDPVKATEEGRPVYLTGEVCPDLKGELHACIIVMFLTKLVTHEDIFCRLFSTND